MLPLFAIYRTIRPFPQTPVSHYHDVYKSVKFLIRQQAKEQNRTYTSANIFKKESFQFGDVIKIFHKINMIVAWFWRNVIQLRSENKSKHCFKKIKKKNC